MTQQLLSMILAIWASLVSTALACIKIWEVWRDRLRLSTSYEFGDDPEHGGNKIIIENPSKNPVMLSYWELLWMKRRGFIKEVTSGRFPDEGYCNITIPAHGRHVLEFAGPEYFEWGHSRISDGKLFLKLHVVGRRKALLLHVYDPRL